MPSLETYSPHLKWIETERERMVSLVEAWANINSGSNNKSGLDAMRNQVEQAFRPLGDLTQEIALPARPLVNEMGHLVEQPTASGLSIIKRSTAPLQLFLNGHLDTVYGPSDPFQKCSRPSPDTLIGPGVADMKGGLVILLVALEALERSPFREFVGWEAFFGPDEEIGSPGSTAYLQSRAPFFNYGIIVEPQFADGAFVSERKGSSTFSLVARGKSAHDGRDFHQGINAIAALLEPLQKIHVLNRPHSATTINIGMINGGTAANRVPDLATARICLRAATKTDLQAYTAMLYDIVEEAVASGSDLVLHQLTLRTPKPFDTDTQALFQTVKFCAELLAMPMTWRSSGGVSDGNTLAALGLPVIDTMGASGGNIHTHDEYINLDKLVARAQHLALVLMYLAHQHAHHGEKS